MKYKNVFDHLERMVCKWSGKKVTFVKKIQRREN